MKAVLILLFMASVTFSQSVDVMEIVRKIDKNEKLKSSTSKGEQIITTSSGKKRTLEFDSYTLDYNDKQLMIYTGPSRVKGDKILMTNDGDDVWFYTPRTDRVRHLASHAKKQKVQGSEFSYEDMAQGDLEEDYTHKLIGEEEIDGIDCYNVESIPTEDGPSYSKLIIWADKEKFVTVKIDYYEDDELLKILTCTEFEKIGNHWIAKNMLMKNVQDGGETSMITKSIEIDAPIKSSLFTTKNLKKR